MGKVLDRPHTGDWPAAPCLKVRRGGQIAGMAAVIAVAVNTDGRREIIGTGPSGAFGRWPSLPDEASIARLMGAVLFGQNDAWATRHRGMQVETFAKFDPAEPDPMPGIITEAARSRPQAISQFPPP